jgi:hypothetical protein
MSAGMLDPKGGLETQHLERFGETQILAFGDAVMWVKIEDKVVCGCLG